LNSTHLLPFKCSCNGNQGAVYTIFHVMKLPSFTVFYNITNSTNLKFKWL
jgi:hypothetical protein